MVDSLHLLVALPLLASLVIFFFGDRLPLKGAWLGILSMAVMWVSSIRLLSGMLSGQLTIPYEVQYNWLAIGTVRFPLGILLDGPAVWMLVVVSTVSLLVQIYSIGYMHDAPRFKRFFAYLNLFTFSMLGLVVSPNYLQFFMGWEMMGLCSYLLISFEYEREAAGRAGNKAFLTTKLGDLGLYAGLLYLFKEVGTLNFLQVQNHFQSGHVVGTVATVIALLIFCGSIGKSAQFPLHVWLPDAMEGPTPVSALIHAATMVAAGVFLVARLFPLLLVSPEAMHVIAWTGGFTSLFAATMALTATDIKKVLAFSTISQLGYMVMGLGVSGHDAGLFHLITHASFKALLFLGAGSVIHAVHTNDMWKMGGLSRQMPFTAVTFFVGSLALAGIPWMSGYFSKDLILSAVYSKGYLALFSVGCLTALMTAFYMTRACVLTFLGEPRDRERFTHAHESPWSMTIPLIILAIPSLFLGWWMHHTGSVEKFLSYPFLESTHEIHWVSLAASGTAIGGILLGFSIYLWRLVSPEDLYRVFPRVHQLFSQRWYVDQVYEVLFIQPLNRFAKFLSWFDYEVMDQVFADGFGWVTNRLATLKAWIDDVLVDGIVNGSGESVFEVGSVARKMQSGLVQNYFLIMSVGLIFLIGYWIF